MPPSPAEAVSRRCPVPRLAVVPSPVRFAAVPGRGKAGRVRLRLSADWVNSTVLFPMPGDAPHNIPVPPLKGQIPVSISRIHPPADAILSGSSWPGVWIARPRMPKRPSLFICLRNRVSMKHLHLSKPFLHAGKLPNTQLIPTGLFILRCRISAKLLRYTQDDIIKCFPYGSSASRRPGGRSFPTDSDDYSTGIKRRLSFRFRRLSTARYRTGAAIKIPSRNTVQKYTQVCFGPNSGFAVIVPNFAPESNGHTDSLLSADKAPAAAFRLPPLRGVRPPTAYSTCYAGGRRRPGSGRTLF